MTAAFDIPTLKLTRLSIHLAIGGGAKRISFVQKKREQRPTFIVKHDDEETETPPPRLYPPIAALCKMMQKVAQENGLLGVFAVTDSDAIQAYEITFHTDKPTGLLLQELYQLTDLACQKVGLPKQEYEDEDEDVELCCGCQPGHQHHH